MRGLNSSHDKILLAKDGKLLGFRGSVKRLYTLCFDSTGKSRKERTMG